MPDPKPDVLDTANQVIVLAFDLTDATLPKTPKLLLEALESSTVRDAITGTLLAFAKTKSKNGVAAAVTSAEGRALLESLGTTARDAGKTKMLDLVSKTPEFKRLEAGVNAFKKAAESSPLGVWVDKERKILYIVGAALVVGFATALYISRTGGSPVKTIVDFVKQKEFPVLQIGKLTFKAALWDFQPDARILGARILTAQKWEKVSVELKLGVLAKEADVLQVDGAVMVKAGPVNVSATGTAKPHADKEKNEKKVNLGLQVGYTGKFNRGQFNIGVGAMYQDDSTSATLNASLKKGGTTIGVKGNVGPDDRGATQFGVMLTVSGNL